jgi:hypothetical protein
MNSKIHLDRELKSGTYPHRGLGHPWVGPDVILPGGRVTVHLPCSAVHSCNTLSCRPAHLRPQAYNEQ